MMAKDMAAARIAGQGIKLWQTVLNDFTALSRGLRAAFAATE